MRSYSWSSRHCSCLHVLSLPFFPHVSRHHLFPLFAPSGSPFNLAPGNDREEAVLQCVSLSDFIFVSLFPLNRLCRENRGNKPTLGCQLCLAWWRKWKLKGMAHLAMPKTISVQVSRACYHHWQSKLCSLISIQMIYFSSSL